MSDDGWTRGDQLPPQKINPVDPSTLHNPDVQLRKFDQRTLKRALFLDGFQVAVVPSVAREGLPAYSLLHLTGHVGPTAEPASIVVVLEDDGLGKLIAGAINVTNEALIHEDPGTAKFAAGVIQAMRGSLDQAKLDAVISRANDALKDLFPQTPDDAPGESDDAPPGKL